MAMDVDVTVVYPDDRKKSGAGRKFDDYDYQFGAIDSGSGWRPLFVGLSITRAVMRFTPPAAIAGRQHYYLFGFDPCAVDPCEVEELVDLGEASWAAREDPGLAAFPLVDIAMAVDALRDEEGGLSSMAYAASGRCISSRGTMAGLFFRSRAAGVFSPDLCQTIEFALALFLDQAAAECDRQRHDGLGTLLRTLFDQMVHPTILVDAQVMPLLINSAAREVLLQRRILMRTTCGAIAAPAPCANKAIRSAVLSAIGSEAVAGRTHAVRIGRDIDDWRLALIVPASAGSGPHRHGAAIIVVLSPHSPEAPACVLDSLGLIPSEQRFLDYFLRASSIAEAAHTTGLSEETARTYLKRVRAKLGAHRQMDLARLIYGLVPPFELAGSASE
jgi:DNA-binding CsgD family transcriptional regulator